MRVVIEKICGAEELDALTQSITPNDRVYIEGLASLKRRREVASWRYLLRRTLREMGLREAESDIVYSDVGAPRLADSDIHIGVSHSSHLVAVIISAQTPCAIDIEDLRRDFQRVAHKYSTPDERALFGGDERALALIWSAKEALYKLSNGSGLDMIEDIEIKGVETNILVGRVIDRVHTLRYTIHDSHVVVHT